MEVIQILGLTKTELAAAMVRTGTPYRIVREDDKSASVTADVRPERANIVIEAGLVSEITYG
jgi:hypothetical protein